MDNLLELFLNVVLSLWDNVGVIFTPIVDFITSTVTEIIPLLINVIEWFLGAIVDIIEFFSKLFGFNGNEFGIGGGGI